MEVKVTLLNEDGLHARPAGVFVKSAGAFTSKIDVSYNSKTANAKSLLSLLSLGLTKDSDFIIKAEGDDAEQALNVLSQLVQNKFQV